MKGRAFSHWTLWWWPQLLLGWLQPGQSLPAWQWACRTKAAVFCTRQWLVISMLSVFLDRTDVLSAFFCFTMMAGSQWSGSNFTFSEILGWKILFGQFWDPASLFAGNLYRFVWTEGAAVLSLEWVGAGDRMEHSFRYFFSLSDISLFAYVTPWRCCRFASSLLQQSNYSNKGNPSNFLVSQCM